MSSNYIPATGRKRYPINRHPNTCRECLEQVTGKSYVHIGPRLSREVTNSSKLCIDCVDRIAKETRTSSLKGFVNAYVAMNEPVAGGNRLTQEQMLKKMLVGGVLTRSEYETAITRLKNHAG